MAGEGLVSMTPTSVQHAGTSATINADGGVDFTSVTSLSLNGVFTSSYGNYCVFLNARAITAGLALDHRYRLSGSDATGSNYVEQYIFIDAGGVSGARSGTQTYARLGSLFTSANGMTFYCYGPAVAQGTVGRNIFVDSNSGARIYENAISHNVSTAYDGLTLFTATPTASFTGTIHVFGYEE